MAEEKKKNEIDLSRLHLSEEEIKEILEKSGGLSGCIREPTLSEKIKIGLSKIFG